MPSDSIETSDSFAAGRVEFGYGDNGRIGGINFQRRHAGVALGVRF
ncbi:MAG: hypothetical protein ACREO7_15535 [Pseudoxanthomonas sp.]